MLLQNLYRYIFVFSHWIIEPCLTSLVAEFSLEAKEYSITWLCRVMGSFFVWGCIKTFRQLGIKHNTRLNLSLLKKKLLKARRIIGPYGKINTFVNSRKKQFIWANVVQSIKETKEQILEKLDHYKTAIKEIVTVRGGIYFVNFPITGTK